MFEITQEAIDQRNAAAVKAAAPRGQVSQAPVGYRPATGEQPGAAGHGATIDPARAHLEQRGTGRPESGALDASVAGSADVQRVRFAGESNARFLDRLGPRMPSGNPAVIAGQAEHTAPTGAGAQFRVNGRREGYVPAAVPAEAMRARGGAR